MGCGKCGSKKPCGCNGTGEAQTLADVQAQLSALQDTVDQIAENAKFLLCGHPIIMIENADDIAAFDLSTGIGSECWEGWGICNGAQYYNATLKKNIQSPNLLDRFVVAAGGTYTTGDTGGADTVALVAAENGPHTHTITDPGHVHTITDPGHDHPVDDPGHTHAANSTPHTHSLTINSGGDHNHQYASNIDQIADAGTGAFAWDGSTLAATSVNGAHTHTGSADAATSTVDVDAAFTGVGIDDNVTGITGTNSAVTGLTIDSQGAGTPHENRPPYFALIFVIKI